MIQFLKDSLKVAQDRMKRYADLRRTDRQFEIGDWVYLKLQPYKQITARNYPTHKLSPKFFGPNKIIEKIGSVAYRLQLPEIFEFIMYSMFHN